LVMEVSKTQELMTGRKETMPLRIM
jgi:hypothetical protein